MTESTRFELRHLRYFVAVAEELSFTRAAHRLGTSQPSLSQQIRQLEAAVGVRLLDRSRHHVSLTSAGRELLRQANDIVNRVERAARRACQAEEGLVGSLSVGTFASADVKIFPVVRESLQARLPEVDLVLHSKYAIDPIVGLRTGALDVAFMRGPSLPADLEFEELVREPLVLVLRHDHPLSHMKRIPTRSLDKLPWVTLECPLAKVLNDAVNAFLRAARYQMSRVAGADTVLGGLQLVQQGLGVAILPESIGTLAPSGVVVRPFEVDPAPTVSIVIGWTSESNSPLVRRFVEIVRQHFVEEAA